MSAFVVSQRLFSYIHLIAVDVKFLNENCNYILLHILLCCAIYVIKTYRMKIVEFLYVNHHLMNFLITYWISFLNRGDEGGEVCHQCCWRFFF